MLTHAVQLVYYITDKPIFKITQIKRNGIDNPTGGSFTSGQSLYDDQGSSHFFSMHFLMNIPFNLIAKLWAKISHFLYCYIPHISILLKDRQEGH